MSIHVLPPRKVGRPPKPPGERATKNKKVTPLAELELKRVTREMNRREKGEVTQSEAILRMARLWDEVTGGGR